MASIRLPSASNLLIPSIVDLGNLGVAGGFRRMRDDRTETATVAQEIRDFQLLVAHDEDVGVEPGLIDQSKPCVIEGFYVGTGDLHTDLLGHPAYLGHLDLPSVAAQCSGWPLQAVKPRIAMVAMQRTG